MLIAEALTITTREEATSSHHEVAFLLAILLLSGEHLPRGVIEPPCDLVGHGLGSLREG